jgi:hypothetical protein
MELNGWTSPQMLRRYGASARAARARRSYDRVMEEAPLPGRHQAGRVLCPDSLHRRDGRISRNVTIVLAATARDPPDLRDMRYMADALEVRTELTDLASTRIPAGARSCRCEYVWRIMQNPHCA